MARDVHDERPPRKGSRRRCWPCLFTPYSPGLSEAAVEHGDERWSGQHPPPPRPPAPTVHAIHAVSETACGLSAHQPEPAPLDRVRAGGGRVQTDPGCTPSTAATTCRNAPQWTQGKAGSWWPERCTGGQGRGRGGWVGRTGSPPGSARHHTSNGLTCGTGRRAGPARETREACRDPASLPTNAWEAIIAERVRPGPSGNAVAVGGWANPATTGGGAAVPVPELVVTCFPRRRSMLLRIPKRRHDGAPDRCCRGRKMYA